MTKSILMALVQVSLMSGILYVYYHYFLRNKSFHQFNRFYLLAAAFLSLAIPFLEIPVYFSGTHAENSFAYQTLRVMTVNGGEDFGNGVTGSAGLQWVNLENGLGWFYAVVCLFLLIRIVMGLARIRHLVRRYQTERINEIRLVNTDEADTPFSFFCFLFWNRHIEFNSRKGQQVFRHEWFHIHQRHSWDLLFFEILTMLLWVNPFFHLMKKEIRAIHEFLADRFALQHAEKWEYAELLLQQALGTRQNLVNPFFHNQIKRRIAMITTSQIPAHRYFRKILVLPLAAGLIFLLAFKLKKTDIQTIPFTRLDRPITVVIDAGHGYNPDGSPSGARDANSKWNEDDIVLSIARKIESLNKNENVRILFSRPTKDLVDLHGRTEFAERNKADIFLSLHVNMIMEGTSSGASRDDKAGFEVYIARKNTSNFQVNKELASTLIRRFSEIYKVDEQVRQRQATVWVLEKTNCPAALIEFGYMNNQADLEFVSNKENQEKIAVRILQSIEDFRMK